MIFIAFMQRQQQLFGQELGPASDEPFKFVFAPTTPPCIPS